MSQKCTVTHDAYMEDAEYYLTRGIDEALLLDRFELNFLHTPRILLLLKFLYLTNNYIDCHFLMSQLNYHVPRIRSHSRLNTYFYTMPCKTNLLRRSPIHLLIFNFNTISSSGDLYYHSFQYLLSCVKDAVSV